MQTFWHDLRYGTRILLKNPVFTAVAVLALTLGIGANTAIFSVVNAVLLRPLPYQNPERLVVLWETQQNIEQASPSIPNYLDWREQNQSFEQMAIANRDSVNLSGTGEPERLVCRLVSANFFSTLGARPQLGRDFLPEEDRPGANPVVIISHGLWQRRFAGDPGVLNKPLTLSDRSYTVIGVMPPEFQFYTPADLFLSINLVLPERLRLAREEHGDTVVVARLQPGVTQEQAAAEMEQIAINLERQYPKTNTTNRVFLRSIYEDQVGNVKTSLLLVLGSVGFVLLIACANVANLLLARAASRQKELTIRAALGAARGRIVRQLLTESLLLAIVGGATGLLLAVWGKDLLAIGIRKDLPWVKEIPLDGYVLAFAVAASLLTGLVFGLIPAWQSSGLNLSESLKEGNKGTTASRQPIRSGLVVAEVALALLLLVGAGLMLRSFAFLSRVDTGFEARNLLTMTVMLSPARYSEAAKVRGFYDELQRRIESLPGIDTIAFATSVPLNGATVTSVVLDPQAFTSYGDSHMTVNSFVSEGYFRAMGIHLLKGRLFTPQDAAKSSPMVTVIDENMARDLFADKDPVGQPIFINEGTLRLEVIGVVKHIRHLSYDADEQSKVKYQMYGNLAQIPDEFAAGAMARLNLLIRTEKDLPELAPAVRQQLLEIDGDVPAYNVKTMSQIIAERMSQRQFLMVLLALFAAVAITLAAVGIYGVISYSVTQRTHEIGVRMALGAKTGDVLRMVIGQGLKLVTAGIAIGLIAAFALTRLLSSLLYGVSATDPVTFVVIVLVLAAVATLACYLPARRATKVDPLIALRYE